MREFACACLPERIEIEYATWFTPHHSQVMNQRRWSDLCRASGGSILFIWLFHSERLIWISKSAMLINIFKVWHIVGILCRYLARQNFRMISTCLSWWKTAAFFSRHTQSIGKLKKKIMAITFLKKKKNKFVTNLVICWWFSSNLVALC